MHRRSSSRRLRVTGPYWSKLVLRAPVYQYLKTDSPTLVLGTQLGRDTPNREQEDWVRIGSDQYICIIMDSVLHHDAPCASFVARRCRKF